MTAAVNAAATAAPHPWAAVVVSGGETRWTTCDAWRQRGAGAGTGAQKSGHPNMSEPINISPTEAVEKIESAKESGRVFGVTFIKRTTGEVRDMNCRGGVKKHLRGGELAYDPKEKRLVTVFDMVKGDYRSINCDSIIRIAVDGTTFRVLAVG